MIATTDVSACFNGKRYQFKKGQQVDAPQNLLNALKKQGAVKAPVKKKENGND